MSGRLFTVSAPSGAGKTSLVNAVLERLPNLGISVSHTTRAMRPGEEDGVNYNFVERDEFMQMIRDGDFLEHAEVFGNLYGTSETWVRDTLAADKNVILEIDWQGAQQVRKKMTETSGIFILPPSTEVLRERLMARGQDGEDVIEARMAEARDEISHYAEADFLIVNDDFETALKELESIIVTTSLQDRNDSKQHQQLIRDLLA